MMTATASVALALCSRPSRFCHPHAPARERKVLALSHPALTKREHDENKTKINYDARKAEDYRFTDSQMFHKILIYRCALVVFRNVNNLNLWYLHAQKLTLYECVRMCVSCSNPFLSG